MNGSRLVYATPSDQGEDEAIAFHVIDNANASTRVLAPRAQGIAALVEALRDPACYPHPVDRVDVLETHISYVLLAGDYAYKLKKAVRLPFLDFSTPQLRRRYCREELRLNRRNHVGPAVRKPFRTADIPAEPTSVTATPVAGGAINMTQDAQCTTFSVTAQGVRTATGGFAASSARSSSMSMLPTFFRHLPLVWLPV